MVSSAQQTVARPTLSGTIGIDQTASILHDQLERVRTESESERNERTILAFTNASKRLARFVSSGTGANRVETCHSKERQGQVKEVLVNGAGTAQTAGAATRAGFRPRHRKLMFVWFINEDDKRKARPPLARDAKRDFWIGLAIATR
jgi:hypothetical protein